MTALNFLLTRALARTLEAGDEVLVTRARPRRERRSLARARRRHRDRRPVRRRARRPLARLRRPRARSSPTGRGWSRSRRPRTRSAPRPTCAASSSWRTRRARSPGSTPSTTARTGRSTSPPGTATCSICSPYKFFGPHMGLAFGTRGAPRSLAPVQGAPGGQRAGRPPVRARHVPARAPRGLRRRRRLRRRRSAGTRSARTSDALGERFLAGLPDAVDALRPADDGGSRPDVLLQRAGPHRAVRRGRSSPSATSPCGRATTTRSRR